MYKRDTRNRLCQLLILLGKEEATIEQQRVNMSKEQPFLPFRMFKRLDSVRKGFISSQDIHDFMVQNYSSFSLEECEEFLRQYDLDSDGVLSYAEFLKAILPSNDPDLFEFIALENENNAQSEMLPYDIENSLFKVLESGIAVSKKTETFKILLHKCPGFSAKEAFEHIVQDSREYLENGNIMKLMDSCGIIYDEFILQNAMKYLDRDQDGKVSLNDWIQSLQPHGFDIEKHLSRLNRSGYTDKSYYLNQSSGYYLQNVSGVSQGQGNELDQSNNQMLNLSQNMRTAPNQQYLYQSQTKKKGNSNFREFLLEDKKVEFGSTRQRLQFTRPNTTISQVSHKLNPNEMSLSQSESNYNKHPQQEVLKQLRELITIIGQIISFEKDIEKCKQDLALCPDFTIQGGFRLFDIEDKGLVIDTQFHQILPSLGVYQSLEDVRLFYSKFDKDHDGVISFGDFVDAFLPKEKGLAQILNSRHQDRHQHVFTKQTKIHIKKLFEIHLQSCFVIEKMLQTFHKPSDFSLLRLFQLIDQDNDGYILAPELQKVSEQQGSYLSNEDIQFLSYNFRAKREGKISFSEFNHHLKPLKRQTI